MSPEICPHCGAEVPPKAKRCPECGSDEETGWSEDSYAQDLGLPEEEFNYDEFVKKEFEGGAEKSGLKWYWIAAAVLVVIGLLAFLIPW